MRPEDIENADLLLPDYIGFVFWKKSRRCVDAGTAGKLKGMLDRRISAVGVFVDEPLEVVAGLINEGIIDIAQLHGNEDEKYIAGLRRLIAPEKKIIRAFNVRSEEDIANANNSSADLILLDAGMGEGKAFDWTVAGKMTRDYILAGGLNPENVKEAVKRLKPYGVDVSSGIETDGVKDKSKMKEFVGIVRSISEECDQTDRNEEGS